MGGTGRMERTPTPTPWIRRPVRSPISQLPVLLVVPVLFFGISRLLSK